MIKFLRRLLNKSTRRKFKNGSGIYTVPEGRTTVSVKMVGGGSEQRPETTTFGQSFMVASEYNQCECKNTKWPSQDDPYLKFLRET